MFSHQDLRTNSSHFRGECTSRGSLLSCAIGVPMLQPCWMEESSSVFTVAGTLSFVSLTSRCLANCTSPRSVSLGLYTAWHHDVDPPLSIHRYSSYGFRWSEYHIVQQHSQKVRTFADLDLLILQALCLATQNP